MENYIDTHVYVDLTSTTLHVELAKAKGLLFLCCYAAEQNNGAKKNPIVVWGIKKKKENGKLGG